MSQASGGRPKVIGMVKRFLHCEADHHTVGETAWSTPSEAKLPLPGTKRPVRRQALSDAVGGEDGWSQESPTIGMTTIEHAVSWLQPSDSFSTSERTSNCTSPRPSRSVKAASSAAGKAAPTAASGGIWSAWQAGKTLPVAATNGVSRVL